MGILSFNSIRAKLLVAFLVFAVMFLIAILIFFWYMTKESEILDFTDKLRVIQQDFDKSVIQDRDFYISERKSLAFHQLATEPRDSIYIKNEYLNSHRRLLLQTKTNLRQLQELKTLDLPGLDSEVDSIIYMINRYERVFDELVEWIIKHGYKNFGYEGEMRKAISWVLNSGYLEVEQILMARRHEKDYMLRGEKVYIDKLSAVINGLKEEADRKIAVPIAKDFVLTSLSNYENSFKKLVEADERITGKNGLRGKLTELSDQTQAAVDGIAGKVKTRGEQIREQVRYSLIGIFVAIMAVVFALSFLVANNLSTPVEALSATMHSVVENGFEGTVAIREVNRKDEIGGLAKDFEVMLRNVRDRTEEVVRQKEEIAKSYQSLRLLRDMGQELTSTLAIDNIVELMYKHITQLMSIDAFLLGIYQEADQSLQFRGGKLQGKDIPTFQTTLDKESYLPVWCFNKHREVISNDIRADLEDSFRSFETVVATSGNVRSVIYLPLITKSKKIGVVSIQSFEPDNFSDYQINILRNLVIYAVIALDNALIYQNLEDTVEKRTATIRKQAEELKQSKIATERAYNNIKLLSEIGSALTSYLSAETIIEQVYEHLNILMDAEIFGIGIVKEEEEVIEFIGAIEDGNKLPEFRQKFGDDTSFAVWCYENASEIIVNDFDKEGTKYLKDTNRLQTKKGYPQSFVYLPLVVKGGKIIAIISIQSYSKNAYTDYQLNILRSLGTYIAIALENAEAYHQIELINEEIEKSNRNIKASINYASRIQNAILPNISEIRAAIPESFVLFMPRDIVSGDFFWFAEKNGKIILAAVDCTGHGVPGAFMSTVGINILFHAVRENGITRPDLILNEMHREVRTELKQDENNNKDGMDAAICTIDLEQKVMQFAGAKNPLIYIQQDELYEIKGDKMPIGGRKADDERLFAYHQIDISEPTYFYIFSDGYQDQFGGVEVRKYNRKRMRKSLLQIHKQPMEVQREILHRNIVDWMDQSRMVSNSAAERIRQIDDILVMGAKVGG